ncbi:hypothetical protein [Comamonas resistens]|uniref:Uncharacterized protein n=1 Tax=Comamonas resistens TaxID=3046670 RepID=A0ABY8SU88_9BURK|nr:hypothetical protein [Comamonas resistens]MDL5037009.1 hypothetical protein [Comamonas resistens]WHS65786.1 hypothetical protein QMY55_01090 [Comamonas resistens]
MKKFAIALLMLCGPVFAVLAQVDRTHKPAEDARWITLIVQAQEGLQPLPISLKYEAQKCKEERPYGVGGQSQSGSMLMRALSFEKPSWTKKAGSHDYLLSFALDGGGDCQWQLQSLEFRLQYQSRDPRAKNQQAQSGQIDIDFRNDKSALRRADVRMKLDYFPVLVLGDDAAKNQLKLRAKMLYLLPHFDPPESGIIVLRSQVFEDMTLIARQSPEDRYSYLLQYPDGSTGKASSQDTIGVEDSRMQCLLETGKPVCGKYPGDAD